MAGSITYTPPVKTRHALVGCEGRPNARNYVRGTVWTCGECKQEWVVVEGMQYNEPYTAWRKLTERNRDGRDY
jgi:hypothetical protein